MTCSSLRFSGPTVWPRQITTGTKSAQQDHDRDQSYQWQRHPWLGSGTEKGLDGATLNFIYEIAYGSNRIPWRDATPTTAADCKWLTPWPAPPTPSRRPMAFIPSPRHRQRQRESHTLSSGPRQHAVRICRRRFRRRDAAVGEHPSFLQVAGQIAQLTALQADTPAYVAKAPALVALQPEHAGWAMPPSIYPPRPAIAP